MIWIVDEDEYSVKMKQSSIQHPFYERVALSNNIGDISSSKFMKVKYLNTFMTEAVIIQKRVHWFAEQINGQLSIW